METGATEERRSLERAPIEDILDGYHRVHYSKIGKLPEILKRGLYSGQFAARIGDDEYPAHNEEVKYVGLSADIGNDYLFAGLPNKDDAGILIKRSSPASRSAETELVRFRIAPREFVGIVIPDDYNHRGIRTLFPNPRELRRFVDQRSEEIKTILAEAHMDLPIYGSTGNLYWPERISHDQVMRRNLGVKRNPMSNLLQAVSRIIKRKTP